MLRFFLPLLAGLLTCSPSVVRADDAKPDGDKKAASGTEAAKPAPKKKKVIPYESGIPWAEPEKVTPGARIGDPPSDAVVLFDGTNLDAWNGQTDKWVLKDGYGVAMSRIMTKEKFGDCQLHVEFMSPPEDVGEGQGKGNNGIGLMDAKYEIQVLAGYNNKTYFDGQATAIYKQHPPLVNASLPTGEWQTYDILFTAPRFHEDGSLKSPAAATVFHNGVVTQNHFELKGDTPYDRPPSYTKHADRLPIHLMYHNDPVRFRNIWVRDLMGDAGKAQLQEGVAEKKTAEMKPTEKK